METAMRRMCAAAKTAVAVALALGAATTAEAARYWTGNTSSNWSEKNWNGTSGRRYFFSNQLTGNKRDWAYLSGNVTESIGLCFGAPPSGARWRFQGQGQYSYNNSAGSAYDNGLVCIGYSSQSSSARFHAIAVTTKNLTVGGDPSASVNYLQGSITGHLVLDELDNAANAYLGTVSVTATQSIDLYKGDLYATNATVACSGNMQLGNFVLDTTGGDWSVEGDLKAGISGGVATITQRGGTFSVASGKWTRFESGSTSTLNVIGGTFKTRRITNQGAASASVVLDGGTVKVNGDASNYGLIDATVDVRVGADGGTIDTSGRSFHVPAAVNAVENTAGAFTVTGGGAVTFQGMGNLVGALTVGDGTAFRWFDQDGAVSASCGFTSLALGAGSTIYLDADATAADALPATVTTTATAENKANIVVVFSALPATGATFTLFPAASADVFNVSPMFGSLVLPNEVAVVDGNLVLKIVAEDYTWNGTQTNWGDADAWTKGGAAATWADGNNAVFDTANAAATLAADASPAKIDFTADATVDGAATLAVSAVSVAQGVTAAISAPTAGSLAKTGTGTLVLGSLRTEQTTVSEGTLAMADGATVDPAKLALGTDPAKPVVFDYGGQTLSGKWSDYLASGMDIILTNGTFSTTQNPGWTCTSEPKTLTIAKDAIMTTSERFTWNTSNTAGVNVTNCVNIAGGALVSTKDNNNWIVQNSRSGTLKFNVFDGGLLELGGQTYVLPCRDSTTEDDTPSVLMTFNDSTFRINNKNLFLGHDNEGKKRNPKEPVLELAMTNSTLDVGTGAIILGDNVVSNNTAGRHTADFVGSVITAKCFKVYHDRPANSARFDNSTLVLTGTDSYSIETHSGFEASSTPLTIGPGGLVIDTQGYSGHMHADPQGEGAITKTGGGILHIRRSQTSSAPLVCAEGETYVYDGLSVARPATVKTGAKFTVKGSGQVSLAGIAFEAGSELRIDGYDGGIVPVAVADLTLPADGTVALTKNSNFSQGRYRILEKAGIAVADVQDKLVPATTGNLAYSWSVEGNTLFLTVGNPAGFAWTGFAGDGKMSTPGNWLGNVAPGAGDPADFSAANMAITVEADIDATLGAVTMGADIVTFNGSLTATSFSDTSKVVVGENSTVTLDGDLEFSNGDSYITFKVNEGGAFVVTGTIRATGSANVLPYAMPSSGWIVAKGLENAESSGDKWNFRLNYSNVAKWVVGEGGFSGTQYFWSFNDAKSDTTIKADADFTIATWLSAGTSSGKGVTLDTSGRTDPAANHTITADCGFVGVKPLTVKGGGTFLCNYVPAVVANQVAFSGAVTVADTATLAINPGKYPTTGAIAVESGAKLALPKSGTVAPGGSLTLAAGSKLEFNLDGKNDTTLDVAGKTLALPGEGTVSVTLAPGSVLSAGKTYTLVAGANLTAEDIAKFTFPGGGAGEFKIADGNLVYIAPSYFTIRIADAGGDFDVKVPGWMGAARTRLHPLSRMGCRGGSRTA